MDTANKKGKLFAVLSGVVIGLVLAVIVLIIVCAVFFSRGSEAPVVDQPITADTAATEDVTEKETIEPTTEAAAPAQDISVDTPFCTLYFPAKWSGNIRTEQIDMGYGYAVHFYGTSHSKETALFSVWFGQGAERSDKIGAIVHNGIATDIFIESAEFSADKSWDAAAADEILAMQADADYLIEKLEENVFFQMPEIKEEEIVPDISDAVLETPYGTLRYPGEWKDAVSWEISSDEDICTVSVTETFSGKNAMLFVLGFGNPDDEGFQMGTLDYNGRDVPVCLTLCDFPQESNWSDSDRNLFIALQEQAYNMLERFAEDSAYTSILTME